MIRKREIRQAGTQAPHSCLRMSNRPLATTISAVLFQPRCHPRTNKPPRANPCKPHGTPPHSIPQHQPFPKPPRPSSHAPPRQKKPKDPTHPPRPPPRTKTKLYRRWQASPRPHPHQTLTQKTNTPTRLPGSAGRQQTHQAGIMKNTQNPTTTPRQIDRTHSPHLPLAHIQTIRPHPQPKKNTKNQDVSQTPQATPTPRSRQRGPRPEDH